MALADDAVVDNTVVEQFLRTCTDIMNSEDTRQMLKDTSSGRPGHKLCEIQKDVWDNLGVTTQAGRLAVGRIDKSDEGLFALKEDFAKTIDAAYLRCLEDRRPSVFKKKGKLQRNAILEFFDACNLMFDSPEVQDRLRTQIKDTGAMPTGIVNEVHGDVMELLGFERTHGQRSFEEFGASKEFEKDREVAVSCARWRGKASSTCLKLLNEYWKNGGCLNVDDDTRNKLLELQAKDDLDSMSFEERAQMLEKNAKRVNVVRGLPLESRKRYLEKLGDDEKLELVKSEILMATLVESQQYQQHLAQQSAKAE